MICLACHIILSSVADLFLLTTFSSTTKRSLQPPNDKLLIGSQQFLTSAHVFCSCFFPGPIWILFSYCSFYS